jgi:hypothetical protein
MKREIARTSCALSIEKVTWFTTGALIAKVELVASVTLGAVKRSWYPVPAVLMPRFVNVATPATAVAVVVPVSAAPAAPVPATIDTVTTVALSAASVTPLLRT